MLLGLVSFHVGYCWYFRCLPTWETAGRFVVFLRGTTAGRFGVHLCGMREDRGEYEPKAGWFVWEGPNPFRLNV